MQTTTDRRKNALIKKFHTLMRTQGISHENKALILLQYGAESTKELSVGELAEVCELIENRAKHADDQWRKRLMAAIFGWLGKMNRQGATVDLVKGIACRAAGVKKYNDIPVERLRSLYYAFMKKAKDLDFVEEVTAAEIDNLIKLN